ncbi:hypothetical protein HZS_1183, partial [Henneguya salminicola]
IQTLNSKPQKEFRKSNKRSSYTNDRENMGIGQRGKQAQKSNASNFWPGDLKRYFKQLLINLLKQHKNLNIKTHYGIFY